ncbi:MAG: hypothetical protein FJ398_23195 [Verrucomicrobia bacterium]|nr:hypothetical protein [Verrucomicrobiota bacterium]
MATRPFGQKLIGSLARKVALGVAKDFQPTRATVSVSGQTVPATLTANDGRAVVQYASDMVLKSGDRLRVELT